MTNFSSNFVSFDFKFFFHTLNNMLLSKYYTNNNVINYFFFKFTGISYFTNSISARIRWCRGHSIRTKIISHVMNETGLRKKQDVTADLQKSRIKKSSSQLQKLINTIEEHINPFDPTLDENSLFHISTGRAADENVADFLLNVEKKGEELRNTFINECALDKDRFDRSLKMNNIMNFTSLQTKKKMKVAGKLLEVRLQRDLFGQLLVIALDQKIDIDKILTYPLTPVPLSLCHLDGSICKTEKCALMKLLETESLPENESIPRAKVKIYDGFFFLHLMKDVPAKFYLISDQFLKMFLSFNDAQYIIIVFDTYESPSIKDSEHDLRGTSRGRKIEIRDRSTRPSDFSAELKNITFKEDLVEYFLESWKRKEMAPFFGNKIVYVNYKECYRYEVIDGNVVQTIERLQSCPKHEEADTKIIYHVCNFKELEPPYNVLIRCSDTDILVIMLGNMNFLQKEVEVWMDVGVGKSQRNINVSKLYESLGTKVCDSLPAFHALTGCDFNPAFFRKGKKRPFLLLRNSDKYMDALTNLSKYRDGVDEEVFNEVEEFVCRMYGYKKLNRINEIRSAIFLKTYNTMKDKEIFRQKVQSFDASALPPCQSELREHLKRTAYISQIWSNAHLTEPTTLSPLDCGWEENENGKYSFTWFTGDQLPQSIDDVTLEDQFNQDPGKETCLKLDFTKICVI